MIDRKYISILCLIVIGLGLGSAAIRHVRLSSADREMAKAKETSDDPEVLHQEALKYFNGDGYRKNAAKAAQLWTRAAEKGHLDAQFNLGLCYLHGDGVPKDGQKGVEWIQESAAAGLPDAEYEMGFLLSNGIGVPKNPTKAIEWYLRAAEKGDSQAFANLGYCYGEGLGVPRSEMESTYWYRKAAERGEFIGMFGTAVRLQCGAGIEKDSTEAYKWYLLARAGGATSADSAALTTRGFTCKHEIEKALAESKVQLSREQIEDAKQRANRFVPAKQTAGPRLEQGLSLELKEPSGLLRVTIERVLIGQRTVDHEVFSQFQLDEERRRGHEMIYFQIAVKNLSKVNDFDLSNFGFTLRDDRGNSYPVEHTSDYLHGKAFPGDTVRGGIAFAVQQGCTPFRLIYDPGLVKYVPGFRDITEQRVLAHTTDLVGIEIFKHPLERR